MVTYFNNLNKYKEAIKMGSFKIAGVDKVEIKLASLEFNNFFVDLNAVQYFDTETEENLKLDISYGFIGNNETLKISEAGNKIIRDQNYNLFDNSQVLKDLVKIMTVEFYDEFAKNPKLFEDLQEYLSLRENYSFAPKHLGDLKELCNNPLVNLADIDTSNITDMSGLFEDSERQDFSGIETWDVSNVKDMSYMFCNSKFDHDISHWNLNSLHDASHMFEHSSFSRDLSSWKKWMSSEKIKLEGIAEDADCFEIPKSWNLSEERFLTAINSSICGSHEEGYWPDLMSDNDDAIQGAVSIITKAVELYKEYSGEKNLPNIYRPWSEDYLKKLCEDTSVKLSEINVSEVDSFSYLFKNSKRKANEFSGIEKWDVSNGDFFYDMFDHAKINLDLSNWKLKDDASLNGIFNNSEMSEANLKKTLDTWQKNGNLEAAEELKNLSHSLKKMKRYSK